MPQNLLTDVQIRKAKPGTKPMKLADGGGLYLLVKPSGAKLWRLKFRLGGKEGLYAVGAFPAMGLAEARRERADARALVDKGINPAQQRRDERNQQIAATEARRHDAEGAFNKVADAWLEDGEKAWKKATHRAEEERVKRYLREVLGAIPIEMFGGSRTSRTCYHTCRNGGAWAAVDVKGRSAAIFDFAVRRGLVDANPIPGLRALTTIPVSESKAALTLAQISPALHQAARVPRLSRNRHLPALHRPHRLPSLARQPTRNGPSST